MLDVLARFEAVDDRIDAVLLAQGQRRHVVKFIQHAVDADPHIALGAQLVEHLHVLAFAVFDDRGQQHEAFFRVLGQGLIDHLADGLGTERVIVVRAVRGTDAREQQAQVIIDFGDGADRGTRVVRGRFLLDGNGRGQALDMVEVRLFHHAQELAGIGRQRLDVAALALSIDGVECQRALAGAGQTGDDDQLVAGQIEVNILQIMGTCTADADKVHHRGRIRPGINRSVYQEAVAGR